MMEDKCAQDVLVAYARPWCAVKLVHQGVQEHRHCKGRVAVSESGEKRLDGTNRR